jgi:cyclopropane fatty-acyl-phospholipid synthase-like methyltransferase
MAMIRYNEKDRVRDHYDRTSSYYRELWGEHLHHGYWVSGEETKEQAQIQLVEHLVHMAALEPGCRVLDVGCGFGASSVYLAKKYGVEATGITISPVQVEMARKAAALEDVNAKFAVMDAEEMRFEDTFDVVWSIESISHYPQKQKFFASAARCLESGGTLAITDWFKKEHLDEREYKKSIEPIEKGMLVELDTMQDYAALAKASCMRVIYSEILNKNCVKTWDLCLDILKNKALWQMAAENGLEFVDFLQASRAVRAGFTSGNFVYGLIIAKKL